MTPSPNTVIDVADLHGRPGASRRVSLLVDTVVVPEVPLVAPAEPVAVELLLESLVDGILARGTVVTSATLSCARCLTDMPTKLSTDVVEMFADPTRADDPEDVEVGYEIADVASHPVIDVETLIRDALTDAMPLRPLCRADCAGLCATCGADLNVSACDCVEDVVDDRWSALRSLNLPEGPSGPIR